MKTSRKYAIAVAFLVVLAVAFGVFGTVAPPLAEEVSSQQESFSESVGHFQNPPTYDSGWVDIRAKAGHSVTLRHGLNTSEVVVDIMGKQSLEVSEGAAAWLNAYGGTDDDYACSVVESVDGGYALAGYTESYGSSSYNQFWLVKTDSAGNVLWNQTYGYGSSNEVAQSMVETSDGGYAMAGSTTYWGGAGSWDCWLVKIESSGHWLWSQTYGGASSDYASSVVETSDGGYALAGYTYSFGAGFSDFWLVKTDLAGNHLWNKTYGGAVGNEFAYSVTQTSDGGYALAGSTTSFGAGFSDFWLVKTDSAGNEEWNRTYGGADFDNARSVVETSDGGYAIAGSTNSYGVGGYDMWLVKTDSTGNVAWSQTYGGAVGYEVASSVVETVDGGYALAGSTTSYSVGSYDFWLVKTDSSGNVLWNKTYGGATSDQASSVVETSDGGYVLAGSTNSYGVGGYDMWLVKAKPEMNMEHQRNLGGTGIHTGWSRTYGGASDDRAYSVVPTSDGGYAIAGYTYSFSAYNSPDFQLVKTDAAGTIQWNKTYDRGWGDVAYSLVQTDDGGYALAGSTGAYGYKSVWFVKTDSAGNPLWNRTYSGGTDDDEAYCLVQTSDGGYALAGYTDYYGGGFWLVKTDAAGNALWNQTYGGWIAYSLVQTGDGGYALAGYTYTYEGGYDFWLVKTDSTGTLQWNKTYTRGGDDYAYSLVQTCDGGYLVAGKGGWYDAWLVKIDSAGNEEWNRTYGGPSYDVAYSVVQTSDGGYALAGYTDSYGAGGVDFWLVKLDSAGNVAWTQTYGGAGDDYALSLVQTSDGGYALAGYTDSYGAGLEDFWLVKSDVELGLTKTGSTNNSITLYRGKTDLDWNYVRLRIWTIKEPSWIYGDINMDGVVDAKDLYILGTNYGKSVSLLSLGGIVAIAGIHTVKKRKQPKQPSHIT